MTDVRKILRQIADQEAALQAAEFLAPCVPGGMVKTRVDGLLYTFTPRPRHFEGWAIFRSLNAKQAAVVGTASLPQISSYLQLFRPLRVRLATCLQGQTWLAYPTNESDARQRLGAARPLPIHLMLDCDPFEQVVGRWDGNALWFEELDRRADPGLAEKLRDAWRHRVDPRTLQWQGITPEMRAVYDVATQQAREFAELLRQRREEARLRDALQRGGGTLRHHSDRGDYWLVEWTTASGEQHSSAISKQDLTVVSAGICLAGRDRDFDLQSLVGVVEGQENGW